MDIFDNKNIKRGSLNLQKNMEIRCIQKEKDYCIYATFFYISLMVTIQNEQQQQKPP